MGEGKIRSTEGQGRKLVNVHCNLGSNNVIVSSFKTEVGSARSQRVKVSRQLSAQFLVPLGLTGDGSGLAGLEIWSELGLPTGQASSVPHGSSPLLPLRHTPPILKRRRVTASVPAHPFSTAPDPHLHGLFPFCRALVTAMSQQQGKQENP